VRLLQIDAFTGKAFAGNPAAVCLLDGERDSTWMQDVAAEMNLSETAFVSKRPDGAFDLRWFTPTLEVDLCGHATLASAHALWEEERVPIDSAIAFHTRSGVLTCHRRMDRIEMDFPSRPVEAIDPPAALIDALGREPASTWQSVGGYLLEYESPDDIRGLKPRFGALTADHDEYVSVTAPGGSDGFDFVSRFFVFGSETGIDEDPVTGSAHCMLADFWSKRSGRTDFRAYQASARGGVVFARIEGDRVHIGGQAVTVLRGELV
jgi:predicted PhzF superfamily epimerase YddE/YHI9